VVSVELPHFHYCELVFYLRMGSRFETPENNGISHFLEHMLFRGNKRYPDYQLATELIEDLGGSINAYTSKLFTSVNLHVLPRFQAQGLGMLSSYLIEPLFRGIRTERKIVLEELLEDRSADGEDIQPENLTRQLAFPVGNPVGLPIIGTPSTIKTFKKQDLSAFHERHVRTGNMVLCSVGAVDHDLLVEEAFRQLGHFPSSSPVSLPPVPTTLPGPRFCFVENAASKNDVLLSFFGPPELDEGFLALMLVKRHLDSNRTRSLYNHICIELGLAYDIQVNLDPQYDHTCFDISFSASADNVPRIITEVLNIIRELREQGLDEDELDRARTRLGFDLEYSLDSPSYLSEWFGGTQLYTRPHGYNERLTNLARLTRAKLEQVMAQVFRSENCYCAVVGKIVTCSEEMFRL